LDGKPRPIALTLADEPSRDYMDSFGRYAKRVAADGIPATTVCTWGDFPSAIEKASTLSIIAHDNYPFFASSNGPRGDSSYSYFTDNVASFVRKADVAGMVPWAMPQAYQEVWGPGKFDEKGNAIVLPGGGLNWQMPTAAQIRWQTWASVALGAKGVVFFAYAVTAKPDPLAKPVTMNWALTTETATGAPLGLVSWPEFSPSAQYRAMASSFAEVKPLCSLLSKLRAATGDKPLATLAADKAVPGDLVCVLSDAASSDYYVVVVASPKDGKRTLQVQLLPEVNHLLPLGGAPAPVLLKSGPARVMVTLEPGQGALYELVRRH